MNLKTDPLFIVLLIVLLLLVGSGCTYFGFEDTDYWKHVRSMPVTNCTLTSSSYDNHLYIHVSYTYEVNGTNYSSSEIIKYGGRHYHEDDAQRIVRQMYTGRVMTIRYEESNPQICHLKLREINAGPLFIGMGICSIAAAPFVGLFFLRDRFNKWMEKDEPLKDR